MTVWPPVVGFLLVFLALVDLFLTVFNYDGFTFIAGRYQRALWRLIRLGAEAVPRKARPTALSVASASMLPATVMMWLALEIVGFGLVYRAGMTSHGLAVSHGVGRGIGGSLYFSAGAISTLTIGDVVPTRALWRAVCDLEAMVGLATFTLALGYVVTTFSVLSDLDSLHNTVRLHAENPERPSSILARHYRGGSSTELPGLLQALSQNLESYDEGLRRYPVVYYFHTRRTDRSVPRVFWSLGELLALIRWGLPADEEMTADPWLAALLDQYRTTILRLQRSFVGPWPAPEPSPLDEERFSAEYAATEPQDRSVADFVSVQTRARAAAGMAPARDEDVTDAYRRYTEWLQFAHRMDLVLDRISVRLGYGVLDVRGSAPAAR